MHKDRGRRRSYLLFLLSNILFLDFWLETVSGRTLQRLSEDAEGTTISEEVKESSLPLDVADVYYKSLGISFFAIFAGCYVSNKADSCRKYEED